MDRRGTWGAGAPSFSALTLAPGKPALGQSMEREGLLFQKCRPGELEGADSQGLSGGEAGVAGQSCKVLAVWTCVGSRPWGHTYFVPAAPTPSRFFLRCHYILSSPPILTGWTFSGLFVPPASSLGETILPSPELLETILHFCQASQSVSAFRLLGNASGTPCVTLCLWRLEPHGGWSP